MHKSLQAKPHVNHKPTPQPAVRMPETAPAYPATSPYAQVLQLQAVAGNGHATRVVQQARQRADKAQPLFDPHRVARGHALEAGHAAPGLAPALSQFVDRALATSGSPLHPDTRQAMEAQMGRDFGTVRVHTNQAAAESARLLDAHAYTVGQEVVFGPGQYRPETERGQHLIAHELVHVAQQAPSTDRGIHDLRQVSDLNDPAEVEAHHVAVNGGMPNARLAQGVLYRFEARMHERAERVGLTQGGQMTNEEATAAYFGNWMRDMNQIFVPLTTGLLSPDATFGLMSYLAARKFNRELTPEQFGYYIPAEHIDNPAGLVADDDLLPAQPVVTAAAQPPAPGRLGATRPATLDTPQEDINPTTGQVLGANIFSVDQTGMMAYLRRTNLHIERRLQLAADRGRTPDGMQHLSAALHAVEDLFAHSNYVEIAIDRLLRSDPTFLAQVTGPDRSVFTYSQTATVPGTDPSLPQERPVLTTGSFTTSDTLASLASELVGVLSRPLPEPATNEEAAVQDRLMVALLRQFESRLQASPELRRIIRDVLRQAHVPDILARRADQMPLADIYQLQQFLGIPIPNAVRIPLKRRIRLIVSQSVLQPLAAQVQAAGLEARTADTNLIQVLRDNQRQQRGQFSDANLAVMQMQQVASGAPPAQLRDEASAAAGRHAQAIQATPLPVVAGPSHTQLGKDHPNSPLFGASFLLGSIAVQRLKDRMLAVWAEHEGGKIKPFDFSWENFPQAAPSRLPAEQKQAYAEARAIYHVNRPTRAAAESESLQAGQAIIAQGGQPGQPYDLAKMRTQAANRVKKVAAILKTLANTTGNASTLLGRVQALGVEIAPQLEERVQHQLSQAQAAADASAKSQAVADLRAVAETLVQTAALIHAARRHQQREQANAELVQRRQEVLQALARRPELATGLTTGLLTVLDEEIQATAVAYTSEQRAVLEGRQTVPEMGPSPRALTVENVVLPPITGSPAMVALLSEARLLFAHPYDNTWWEQPLRTYANQFASRLLNDIEARNEGVPLYRTPTGGHGGHGGHP